MNWIEVKNEKSKIGNSILVECVAVIRNNETNEIREYEIHELLENGNVAPSVFNWEENNYSCDCNRHLFFKRANDEETPQDFDMECTNGKYSVNLKNKKDDKVYYREFDDIHTSV